jgi:uncharacterized protein YxjI
MERFSHDVYLIDQLVRPIANLYRVTPIAAGAPVGAPVAFVRQKKLAIREDIRFFADEGESEELFRLKARSMLDIGGARYDVAAADGSPVGRLEHVFGKSIIRSTWRIVGSDETEAAIAREKSAFLGVARRVVDFVPYVGGLIPIPYDFVIASGEQELGHYTRQFMSLRDRYTLDLSGDADRRLDRRLGIALAIALDALQNR